MSAAKAFRQSRERGNPASFDKSHWVPASAGTTSKDTESLGSNA